MFISVYRRFSGSSVQERGYCVFVATESTGVSVSAEGDRVRLRFLIFRDTISVGHESLTYLIEG